MSTVTQVVAIANAAGSAGKSTTTVAIAALLARQGRRVLVVDGDAQATATGWLGVTVAAGQPTTGDVLLRRVSLHEATVATPVDGVSVVPAARRLDGDSLQLTSVRAGEQRLRLALEADPPAADVVLVDCPGSVSIVTVAAMVAADAVVTVTQPTLKELQGLPELEATIAEVAEAYRPGLRLAAVVPCIVPAATAGRLYVEAMQLLTESYPGLVTAPVRRSARVPESYAASTPVPLFAPREPVTGDYQAVVADLCSRGVL